MNYRINSIVEAIILSILAGVFLSLVITNVAYSKDYWDVSPVNYDNSSYNWDNSSYNWKNSPMNPNNNPYTLGKNVIYTEDGLPQGYITPKPNGGYNIYNLRGNRLGYN